MKKLIAVLFGVVFLGLFAANPSGKNYQPRVAFTNSLALGSQTSTVIEFDGASDIITGVNTAWSSGTTYSIVGWIRPIPTSDDYGCIVASSEGLFYRGSSRKLDIFQGTDHLNTTALTENVWTHFAMVNNAGSVTFYLNGVSDGTASTVGAVSLRTIGNTLGGIEGFKGRLALLAVHSIALNGTQVANLASKSTTSTAIGSLLAYWKLDEVANGSSGNGVTFVDSNGAAQNATGTGTTGRTADY